MSFHGDEKLPDAERLNRLSMCLDLICERLTDLEDIKVQREREGPPVSLKETGPVVLDSARSELLTDRTTGHCDKVGDPYRRGHVQRTVAGMPSGSGPLNKLRRQATGDNGWILDGTPADMSKTGRIIPPEETFERWSIGHHPSGGTLQRGDAGWAMASTSSLF